MQQPVHCTASSTGRWSTTTILLCALTAFVGCSTTNERSEQTMDTGLPISAAMQAYDVERYTLRHEILVEQKAIAGSATIAFNALAPMTQLELNFDPNYDIERIESGGNDLTYEQTDNSLLITLEGEIQTGDAGSVTVHYHGVPIEAVRPPWNGGFTWEETPSGKPWIATSFQGEGCDIWWPCKDHPSDEPSGVDLYITVPDELVVAANGVLIDVQQETDGRQTYHWQTNVMTNNYGIALNIAPYVKIESVYQSSNGTSIPVVFYAIEDHEEQARALFDSEMHSTLEFFERVVGPYPWGQEKVGIAETPHLGMEHQTINAYGNEFKRDDYGFDWLLHHEFAHEWFGNLVSVPNYADLWIHEGLGAYMQIVYTEEVMGDAAAHHRLYKSYLNINSCQPVSPRGEFSDDQLNNDGKGPAVNIYTKGSWVAHSLRYVLGDDLFWDTIRFLLYGTTEPDKLQPPISAVHRTTDDFATIASDISGQDMSWFFEVYVRNGPLPELDMQQDGSDVVLTWQTENDLPFDMPVPVRIDGSIRRIEFSDNVARLENLEAGSLQIDPEMRILRKLASLPSCEEQIAEEAQAEAASDSD